MTTSTTTLVFTTILLTLFIATTSAYRPAARWDSSPFSNNPTTSTRARVERVLLNDELDMSKWPTEGTPIASSSSTTCNELTGARQFLTNTVTGEAIVTPDNQYDYTRTSLSRIRQLVPIKMSQETYKMASSAATRGKVMNPDLGHLHGCIDACGQPKCVKQCIGHSFLAMCGGRTMFGDKLPIPGVPAGPEPVPRAPQPGDIENLEPRLLEEKVCMYVREADKKMKKCNEEGGRWKEATKFMECFKIDTSQQVWTEITRRAKALKVARPTTQDVANCFAKCFHDREKHNILTSCPWFECTRSSLCDVCKDYRLAPLPAL